MAFVRGVNPLGDIFLYRFEDREVVPFVASKAHEAYPEFSPDGRWLAYASTESGRFEVYVTSFPDRSQTRTVSRGGGGASVWSRDGRKLFYLSRGSSEGLSIMAVDVGAGPQLEMGAPTVLFRLPNRVADLLPMRSFELHPDGRHFVIGRFADQDRPPPITRLNIVHSWFTELESLSPTH